jgi:hypothetical protein
MPPRRGHRRPGGPLRGSARGPGFADLGRATGARSHGGEPPARVLIDGRNVQHALARAAGASNLPTAALVARLRAAFSPPTEVELILDGHSGGGPFGRVAPGFHVEFTRGRTADEMIGERVTQALQSLGAVGAWSVVVVTDDREVRDHARRGGVRVEGTAWLVGRLPGGPAIGHAAPRGSKG